MIFLLCVYSPLVVLFLCHFSVWVVYISVWPCQSVNSWKAKIASYSLCSLRTWNCLALTRCSVNIWYSERYKWCSVEYLYAEELIIIYSERLNILMWKKTLKREIHALSLCGYKARQGIGVSVCICSFSCLGMKQAKSSLKWPDIQGTAGEQDQLWKPWVSLLLSTVRL